MQSNTKHSASPPPERTERSEAAAGGGTSEGENSSAPCNPSNTQGANCRALRLGVDSLYLSIQGELSDDWGLRLENAREMARASDDSSLSLAKITLLDHQFQVGSTAGKMFRYLLSDHAYSIKIAAVGAKHLPLAYVQIRSGHLMAVGVEQAVSQLRLILSTFGSVGATLVSRIDLFVDFVSPCPLNAWDYPAWVTRARHIDPHIVDGQFTGWSIGRGEVSARLYDKTLEIKESGKDYMRQVWLECGWDGAAPVYRLEFQLRADALKELSAREYPGILFKLGGIWRYGSTDWLRLSVPNPADQTKSRWPTHPLWMFLQNVEWPDVLPLTRVPIPVTTAPGIRLLSQWFFTALTSYMAVHGIADVYGAWNQMLLDCRDYLESQAEFRQASFDDQARLRAARKANDYGLDFPDTSEQAKAHQDQAVAHEYRKRTGRE